MHSSLLFGAYLFVLGVLHAAVPFDGSAVRPGPVTVTSTAGAVTVHWNDEANIPWTAEFSLDPKAALITAIRVNGKAVISQARPFYECMTGKRRGGWDQFFDLPPSHPDGTRAYSAAWNLTAARARSIGDRVEVAFDGMRMGIFTGGVRYVIYPGSRLIEQVAVLSTSEPDTAYYYDAGLRMTVDADRHVGGNMESLVTYYDTGGQLRTALSDGPERQPVKVRYRAIAARTGAGSVAIFPAPHQYFFPRDFTTNMAYLWHSSWKGVVSLGIRQLPDDATPYYPWSNAPPGTEQQMKMFLMVSAGDPHSALDAVLRLTNSDRYPALDGYITFAPHWHYAYTVQALEKGFSWTPPFKPVLQAMGVNSAMIMDFHGDGHPADTGALRLSELEAYYRACRAQSGPDFLLIPAEEANVHFGGHWAVAFPKPVYWHMSRGPSEPFQQKDPKMAFNIRFLVKPEHRGSTLPFRMIVEASRIQIEAGVQLVFCFCQPHLLNLYGSLGFRPYAPLFEVRGFGLVAPMVLIVPDLAHMRAIRSPLVRYLPASIEDVELAQSILALLPGEPPVTVTASLDGASWSEAFDLLSRPRRRTGPFEGFSETEVTDFLERSQTLECTDGQQLIVKGQDTRPAFVILEGAAEVRAGGSVIARFEEGEAFGEFAMLLCTRRTADVYAAGKRVRLLVLDERTLLRVLSSRAELAAKVLLNISKSLALRLLSAPANSSVMT